MWCIECIHLNEIGAMYECEKREREGEQEREKKRRDRKNKREKQLRIKHHRRRWHNDYMNFISSSFQQHYHQRSFFFCCPAIWLVTNRAICAFNSICCWCDFNVQYAHTLVCTLANWFSKRAREREKNVHMCINKSI